jgi:hypothetical protein
MVCQSIPLPNCPALWHFDEIEDMRIAHDQKLKPAGCFNPYDEPGNPVRVWNFAAKLALAFTGRSRWWRRALWGEYWRNLPGRSNGTTFLMEASPVPRDSTNAAIDGCPYSSAEVWQRRKPLLAQYLRARPPKTIIAYGIAAKDYIEDVTGAGKWSIVAGTENRSGNPVSLARSGSTLLVHTGFPAHGYFNARRDIPLIIQAAKACKKD